MADFPTRGRPEMQFVAVDEHGYGTFKVQLPKSAEKRSAVGDYSGYSAPLYDGFRRHSEYLTVRDGTRLAIDYHIPTRGGVEETRPLPVVWEFTPYGRCQKKDGRFGIAKRPEKEMLMLSYGYIVAHAEVRGTCASFGYRDVTNSVNDARDGHDINEWIYKQKWCDGNIGMFGCSYTGQTMLSTLAGQPEHLKCAFITFTDYNKYDGWIRGAISRAFGGDPDRNPDQTLEAQLEMSVPVDGDEDLTLLRQAVAQHALNGSQVAPFKTLHYRDSWSEQADGEYWNMVSASFNKERINSVGAAVYLAGGLFDVFRRDTFTMYRNMSGPKKMVIGPWYHGGATEIDMSIEHIRFYDRWLKGIDNGIDREEPICIKTQFAPKGTEWAMYKDWPLPEEERVSLFLRENGLSFEPCSAMGEGDDYTADYSIETGVESTDTTDLDRKALVYTTEPMKADMRLTGHPIASIWVSADVQDADFFVTMADVAPDGETFLFSDGHLRASQRKVENPPYDFLGLPWHPSNEADEQPLAPGRPTRLDIDLMPISYVLREGHSIRVQVSNCLRGFFFQRSDPPAKVRLYRDAVHSSYVSLPVIK